MKSCLLIVAGLFLTAGAFAQTAGPAADAHARKLDDIHKILALTGGDKFAAQMFDQVAASMKTSGGPGGVSAEKFFQEFRKELDFKQIEDIVAAAYDKYLSVEDVRGLLQFYESAPGKHMIEALPQINGDMMRQIMPLSQEIARKVILKMQDQDPK